MRRANAVGQVENRLEHFAHPSSYGLWLDQSNPAGRLLRSIFSLWLYPWLSRYVTCLDGATTSCFSSLVPSPLSRWPVGWAARPSNSPRVPAQASVGFLMRHLAMPRNLLLVWSR